MPVILAPTIDDAVSRQGRRYFSSMRMTDHGDHVRWCDGRRSTPMRLPDQPDAGAGYPVLASVLVADYFGGRSTTRTKVVERRIRFLAADGSVIAWLDRRPAHLPAAIDRFFPDPEAYARLAARGVTLAHERIGSKRQFVADHPDPRTTGWTKALNDHGRLITISALVVLVVLVVLALMVIGHR